ncbi:RNA-DNA + DNA-DNA helicase [Sinorhizobium phage phiM7]|uniref:RNA-DNA + DNA-DNA helicase n=2 Tax=Emdodecavirus TaxID=1980937 RepID=S5MCR1_9CAUD|nr:DNA helicase [Sinorhizobium phage phiM12]YP_009601163.1 DNA helicase [Sinorhizobium phage phiM7]AGR47684.1 RNA-DNA + DNA-DNA helicase [Sinorhizobium phage phiM12]AKF12586.1 RNA-DNA + DNA-DNA helicase [Sinorhizobium phage phiM7]AKF12946.1 RNA-DNA + DNA-DNA helicase [Sinorhizobium phage phiM19]
MDRITLVKVDDVYIQVLADPGLKMELSEYFTFLVPGYKHMPAYKQGKWDGKIKLLNILTGRIYTGLVHKIEEFCAARDYELVIDPALQNIDKIPRDVGDGLAALFETKHKPRWYQNDTVYYALKYKRALFLSATSSGKSFGIYLVARYMVKTEKPVLIIVPTKALVRQMAKDFIDYNNDVEPFTIHQIEGGVDKNIKAEVVISTWQSIYKQPQQWFSRFECIIGDECHEFKAKSLIEIMEKTPECEYKLGFTGTLDGALCNELVLTGLFGRIIPIVDTKTLIADGTLVEFNIKSIVLNYSDRVKKVMRKKDYQTEIDYIVQCAARNRFIRNLAWNLKGNTLILTQFVDKQAKELVDLLKTEGKQVLFVSGKDSTDFREEVRRITEANNNVIIVATYGVFQRGINIINLDNLIFAHPSKGKIRNLQSIGRVLRRGINNTKSTLYDIGDNMASADYQNHAMRHFRARIELYAEEGFDYDILSVDLKDEEIT